MFLDKVVFVSKVNTDGPGTDKESFIAHSGFLSRGIPTSAVQVNIQTANAETTMMADGEFFKTYKVFTSASGLVEGMRFTASGTGDTYTVKGRSKFDYGVGQHYELVAIKGGR